MVNGLLSLLLLAAGVPICYSVNVDETMFNDFSKICVSLLNYTDDHKIQVIFFETPEIESCGGVGSKCLTPVGWRQGYVYGDRSGWTMVEDSGRTHYIVSYGRVFGCAHGSFPIGAFRSYSIESMLGNPGEKDYNTFEGRKRCIVYYHSSIHFVKTSGYFVTQGTENELWWMEGYGESSYYYQFHKCSEGFWCLSTKLHLWWNQVYKLRDGGKDAECPRTTQLAPTRGVAAGSRLSNCGEFSLAAYELKGWKEAYDNYEVKESVDTHRTRTWRIYKGGSKVGFVLAREYAKGAQFFFNLGGVVGRSMEDALEEGGGDPLCPRYKAPVLFEDFKRDFLILGIF